MKTFCVSSSSVLGSAPIAPAALRRPAVAISNPPSPFLFGLLFLLGDSKRKSYCSPFYSYIYSLIYYIYSSFIISFSCLCEPVSKGNKFSLRGIRQPAFLLADFVAYLRPFVARKPPASVFAGGFRSAQGIGDRGSRP